MNEMLNQVDNIRPSVQPALQPQCLASAINHKTCVPIERIVEPASYPWPPIPQIHVMGCRIIPERTEIHLARLPHDIKAGALKSLLTQFGIVSNVHIRKGKTDKKCSATAKFSQPIEAAHAIQHLDGKRMGTQILKVKYDRSENGSISSATSTASRGFDSDSSSTRSSFKRASTSTGPLVVNGARGPGYQRRRTEDDECGSDDNRADQKTRSNGN